MRMLLICFLCSALASTPTLGQEGVVAVLEAGSGELQVGIIGTDGVEDEGHFGPQALAVDEAGRLHLLDQNNGRVLVLSAEGALIEQRTIPAGLQLSDLLIVGDEYFGWADGPVRLETSSTELLSAVDTAAANAVVDAFGAVGSREPTHVSELRQSSIELLSAAEQSSSLRTDVLDPSGQATALTITIAQNRLSAEIADDSGRSRGRIEISEGSLGSVTPLKLASNDALFVLAEFFPQEAALAPTLNVVEFDADGGNAGHYQVPLEGAADVPRRFVTVSPDGRVFALRNEEMQSEIILLPRLEGELRPGAALSLVDDVETVAALAVKARGAMLITAAELESIAWAVTSSAHDPNPRSCRVSGKDRTSRPWFIDGKIDNEVAGIPYNWGGMVTTAKFLKDLQDGRKAGNVCTSDPGLMQNTTGNDCSGHVSVVWGLSTKYSTRSIPGIANRVSRAERNLRTGDVLNNPGSHVRIFIRYLPGGMIETSESAITCNGLTGKTCRSTYLLSSMLGAGYSPLRYKGAVE